MRNSFVNTNSLPPGKNSKRIDMSIISKVVQPNSNPCRFLLIRKQLNNYQKNY